MLNNYFDKLSRSGKNMMNFLSHQYSATVNI